MDVVGSEIGQKMRSAIKAKLTELGCYVDDELPDYVMVMVANKRTRAQMEDDLQLFLGDNTELFVNWLHQVLKKLQEVTVTPLKQAEAEKHKERSASKEKKSKDKKDKQKKGESVKKAKKKDKEKASRKKEEKKVHKSKKKSKHHDIIRPNIPPLLMNLEKESEPSITDVFAGQILKNHGVILDEPKVDTSQDKKVVLTETKRPMLPIIDPSTISSQIDSETSETANTEESEKTSTTLAPKEDQIREINEIETKIQGLKQKLAEQLDSMSDDEDFLNIRTEAEELMNDFAEDVLQEISQPTPAVSTPPLAQKSPTPTLPSPTVPKPVENPEPTKNPIETLPQIELKLPKRPIRERLGAREEKKEKDETVTLQKRTESPERFTPEREPDKLQSKSIKRRLGDHYETQRRSSVSEEEKAEPSSKRLTSKVSVLDNRQSRVSCASVVRVRPRPRVSAPASSLLLRAVADAHKSLLNIPPKVDTEPQVKRALVLPMRRCVDAQKIVIQIPVNEIADDTHGDDISLGDMDSEGDDKSSKITSETDKDEYIPAQVSKVNSDYVTSRRSERTTSRRDDTLIIETINIHNPTVDKDRNTQFIVTMDGYHPNAFLAKKLKTEGILDEDDIKKEPLVKTKEPEKIKDKDSEKDKSNVKKRFSDTSEESVTQVVINKEEKNIEKRKGSDLNVDPPVKKRKASPIVFDVDKKEKEREREPERERVRTRTESTSSDQNVVVSTTASAHKFDSVPPLSQAERKLVWCRAFPLCRYGAACAFAHPRCKFAAACTRRNCPYSHSPSARVPPTAPVVASHVVPAANYKSISAVVSPSLCKFYPNCVNPACTFLHPKPCRYGKACANKPECNFYHSDTPTKWTYPV